MSKSIVLQSQQVSCALTITVINRDNNKLQLSIFPLISLTALIMAFWQVQVFVGKASFVLLTLKMELIGQVIGQVDLYCKLFVIAFNSLKWGLI